MILEANPWQKFLNAKKDVLTRHFFARGAAVSDAKNEHSFKSLYEDDLFQILFRVQKMNGLTAHITARYVHVNSRGVT